MQTIKCETLKELEEALASFGPDALYRGQVGHYQRADGSVSLPTSFQRHGCIPPLMLKWTHYAKKMLEDHVEGWSGVGDVATEQAILQHYGWRSFFIDATAKPRVAAWFASHRFVSQKSHAIVEDCFETPVYLRFDLARYEDVADTGHIYVLSRRKLRAAGVGAVHLSEIATRNGSPRYVRQDAYMVGSLYDGFLDPDLVICHITAPAEVLRVYAENLTAGWLFPEPKDDPIFADLLAMPWRKIGTFGEKMDAFERSLPIPEYKICLRKIMPSASAFYRPFWISDLPPPSNVQSQTVRQSNIRCGSSAYHGSAPIPSRLPEIDRLLETSDEVIIETDSLVYHGMGPIYGKGVGVIKAGDGLMEVFEFGVSHPGLLLKDVSRFPGLHYRVQADGTWHRQAHHDDCTCEQAHEDNLRVLGIVNELLADGSLKMKEPGLYVDTDRLNETDPSVLASWAGRQST